MALTQMVAQNLLVPPLQQKCHIGNGYGSTWGLEVGHHSVVELGIAEVAVVEVPARSAGKSEAQLGGSDCQHGRFGWEWGGTPPVQQYMLWPAQ